MKGASCQLVIIQARMASSRLPNKVLLDIAGQPMLARVVERARRANSINKVVVATTSDPSDDPIEVLCKERDYDCYRGSTHDVLDRYYQAARSFGADVIVRLTADCPLIDPDVIDETVNAFLGHAATSDQPSAVREMRISTLREVPRDSSFNFQSATEWDFAANRLPPPWKRTYPIGLDVEVCTFEALERAWMEADQPHQREHVMPYLYEQPGRFHVLVVDHEPDFGSLRWTVDTAEDLELVRRIYAHFPGRDDFSWLEVLSLFEQHPELVDINADVLHKTVHDVDARRDH